MRSLWAILLIYGCSGDTSYTGVRVRANFNPALQVDQVRITGTRVSDGGQAFNPQLVPSIPRRIEPAEDLVILLDQSLNGMVMAIRVDVLTAGIVVGSARTSTQATAGQVVDVDVILTEAAICGDGKLHVTAEDCDDGNTRSADGCSVLCTVEPRYRCSGSPSVCQVPGGINTPANPQIETCGDGTCGENENSCNCGADCGESVCGDGICCGNAGEDTCTCANDCGAQICGDGRC